LQQLAQEISRQTVINNWQFYAVLLALSFLGATLGPYVKARLTKRGEIAATAAQADEILEQLRKTTATAKSVELSLSRGDWIQREKNSLKRTKLEQLIVAGYAISDWLSNDNKQALRGEPPVDTCPINEFVMLSTLYFPELKEITKRIEDLYRTAMIASGPIRIKILRLTSEAEAYRQSGEAELHRVVIENRFQTQQAEQQNFVQRAVDLHAAVEELAQAAHELMEQLTSHSPA
jgi:hypothetical protein